MVLRLAHAASLGLLLILVGWSIAVYPELPDRIPTHFDFSGTPTGWAETSFRSWLLIPVIGGFTYALIAGIGWFMRTHPDKMNVPDRKKFAELPPEARASIIGYTDSFLHVTCALVLLLFLALLWGMREVALGAERVPAQALAVEYAVLLSTIVMGPWFAWFIHRRVGRYHRELRQAQRADA
jgi:uncharacterized membrane protein